MFYLFLYLLKQKKLEVASLVTLIADWMQDSRWVSQELGRGGGSPPSACCPYSLDAAQDKAGFGAQGQIHAQPPMHWHPQAPLRRVFIITLSTRQSHLLAKALAFPGAAIDSKGCWQHCSQLSWKQNLLRK